MVAVPALTPAVSSSAKVNGNRYISCRHSIYRSQPSRKSFQHQRWCCHADLLLRENVRPCGGRAAAPSGRIRLHGQAPVRVAEGACRSSRIWRCIPGMWCPQACRRSGTHAAWPGRSILLAAVATRATETVSANYARVILVIFASLAGGRCDHLQP